MTMKERAEKLLELARSQFTDLKPPETEMLKAAAEGRPAVFAGETDDENDPARADEWGEERTIRADVIRWLCADKEGSGLVDPHGIQVVCAKIEGGLDLNFLTVGFPIGLFSCSIPAGIRLRDARTRTLVFQGSHTASIAADRLHADGSIFLREGFVAEGEVRLLGAKITGDLSCIGGKLENENGDALSADGAKIGGTVFLREGFSAKGGVRLLGANIRGNLDCTNGKLENEDGHALSADCANIGGNVFLSEGFSARGEVRFHRARIGADFDCRGGSFENAGGHALNLEGAEVKRALFMREGFSSKGGIILGLCSVAQLVDDKASWPGKGELVLDGFLYRQFAGDDVPTSAGDRLVWLGLQPDKPFRPHPYEQLAKVLKDMGHNGEAKKVLIAREDARREFGDMPWLGKCWSGVLKWTIGYGYLPRRVLYWVAGAVAIGFVLFWISHSTGMMVQVKELAPVGEAATQQTQDCAPFSPFLYSLDTFLPIVNLHQEQYWEPVPQGIWGSFIWWYLRIHILSGWGLTTLAVAGVTGLVRKE